MSILERLKKAAPTQEKKLFCVVAGPRLAGKTTLAGTLPGRTYLLQAAVLESGSESAKALAAKNKHELYVDTFSSVEELLTKLDELKTDTDFDQVFVDGLSALTEQKMRDPRIAKLVKTDNWAAFRELGESISDAILRMKELTYAEKVKKPKNVWLTCALSIKQDKNGSIVDVSLEAKGNVAVTSITKLGEAVVTVLPPLKTENGVGSHRLITKTEDVWPGRIDGVLAEQNPGIIEPADLRAVLKLKGAK
jgi:hypothetical protein